MTALSLFAKPVFQVTRSASDDGMAHRGSKHLLAHGKPPECQEIYERSTTRVGYSAALITARKSPP
jgi:hypothetical protein